MDKLRKLLILCALLVGAPCAAGAVVAHVGTDNAAGGVGLLTFAPTALQTPTVGNVLVLLIHFNHNPETITYPDGFWVEQHHSDSSGCVAATRAVQVGDTTALGTFTASASTNVSWALSEWSGADLTATSLDHSQCALVTSATPTTTAYTPAQLGDQAIADYFTTSLTSCPCSPKAGWTESVFYNTLASVEMQYNNTQGVGSTSNTWTLTSSTSVRWEVVSLKPGPTTGQHLTLLGVGQ